MWWCTFWSDVGETREGRTVERGGEVSVESVSEEGIAIDVGLEWLWYHIGFRVFVDNLHTWIVWQYLDLYRTETSR